MCSDSRFYFVSVLQNISVSISVSLNENMSVSVSVSISVNEYNTAGDIACDHKHAADRAGKSVHSMGRGLGVSYENTYRYCRRAHVMFLLLGLECITVHVVCQATYMKRRYM